MSNVIKMFHTLLEINPEKSMYRERHVRSNYAHRYFREKIISTVIYSDFKEWRTLIIKIIKDIKLIPDLEILNNKSGDILEFKSRS